MKKRLYELYLNGSFYGCGPLVYMQELITDYIRMGLYGKATVEFKIVRVAGGERDGIRNNAAEQGDRK